MSVVANGNDGWNIQSTVTLVSESNVDRIQVLSQNFDVFYWIDGDGDRLDGHFNLALSTADISPGTFYFMCVMQILATFCCRILFDSVVCNSIHFWSSRW